MEDTTVLQFRKLNESHGLTPEAVRLFRRTIYDYYAENGRNLPWRNTDNPYHILVSEVMLQQTQVERVLDKYEQFIAAFPDFSSLAAAPLKGVLSEWQGLGYNRRAVALNKIAYRVVSEFNGTLPDSCEVLMTLPGIGRATASAIAAFAFHKPAVFLETNIRSVFIHLFFNEKDTIQDAEILPLVEVTLDNDDPREWYYALMDYGVMLKREHRNPTRRSAHYKRQSPFHGSNREMRGMILKMLVKESDIAEYEIAQKLKKSPEVISANLQQLEKEGFIEKKGKRFRISQTPVDR
ncbi:MAG: winged helix-turn-helix transcriptional regulator [Thermodesulfobacteriota bacterium]